KQRTVGQHVLGAGRDMAQSLSKEAGDEFQKLADKMRLLASREKARAELEKLAQQLRDAGSKVAGERTQGMQQLAGNDESQTQGGAPMTNMPNAPQSQPMQMPGFSNAPQGESGTGTLQNAQIFTPTQGNEKPGDKNLAPMPGQPGGKFDPSK